MFFEAMDLYRTLDLKCNPMDSSHVENNFKRIKILQQLGLIWMNLVVRGLTGAIIALWRTLLNNGEVVMRTSHLLLRN